MGLYGPEIIFFALWLGWWLDRRLGEPMFWHPLVGFGRLVQWMELSLNPKAQALADSAKESSHGLMRKQIPNQASKPEQFLGCLALVLMVLPLTYGLWFLLAELKGQSVSELGYWYDFFAILLQGVVLYIALGAKSLDQHLEQIERPLLAGDLEQARYYVSWIVSRDTADMDQMRITRAAIESGLENGSDGAFAPIFWFLVAGAPGVLLYRLSNTLDAMWGYKTARFLSFGWAAARFDDLLNIVPARLTALLYAVNTPLGWAGFKASLACWQKQGGNWESPNAGPVMAAGAGALKIQLGGGDTYHGVWKERPVLGLGADPVIDDLPRARHLIKRTLLSWMLLGSSAVFVVGLL